MGYNCESPVVKRNFDILWALKIWALLVNVPIKHNNISKKFIKGLRATKPLCSQVKIFLLKWPPVYLQKISYLVGQNFRRTKFSSPQEILSLLSNKIFLFIHFYAELANFKVKYKLSKKTKMTKFSSDKIVVTFEKFRHFSPTLFCPIRYTATVLYIFLHSLTKYFFISLLPIPTITW